MIRAIFLDFYGTVVHEDDEVIKIITKKIYDTGKALDIKEIGQYWWRTFQSLFVNSYGTSFRTQRAFELKSLEDTISHFQSTEDAEKLSELMFQYWTNPDIFEDSKEFFRKCPLPIYIVSNIDTLDLQKALEVHNLKPEGVYTSEDARSYKPRKELFELALTKACVSPKEVVHIGDSISSDVKGAAALGINTIWMNRFNKIIPEGVGNTATSLMEVLELLT